VSVVLFGCGSRMIVDVGEIYARLGLEIAAIVKNVEDLFTRCHRTRRDGR
jgi:hypothetical protein